ncbi:MAG TPA: hypothetical protein VM534_01785 [Thermoanaerobaculia bacterium]|nr:hypothetical protein [Thermoanaerobaculia bacterium]
MPPLNVEDLRAVRRFVIDPPVPAAFAGNNVLLFDFGEGGVQAEHEANFRPGLVAKLSIKLPNQSRTMLLHGRIVWSHLSDRTNAKGKFLYRSGIRLEDERQVSREALELLLEACMVKPDTDSLEKKKSMLEDKARRKAAMQRQLRVLRQNRLIPTDQVLMVQQARERLRANPDEAMKWYNRAKYSLPDGGKAFRNKDDVLAVWEYLDRSIELETIARIFEVE